MIELLAKIPGSRVLVIGDIMLDRYWWGGVDRISPEAPVPVVRIERMTIAAGGAANVAANLKSLECEPTLIGVIGDDDESNQVAEALNAAGVQSDGLIRAEGRPTTVKTRLVAHQQHLARIDREDISPIEDGIRETAISRVRAIINDHGAVVISDYAKGFLTNELISAVINLCAETRTPVLVDPKGKEYGKYKGATLLTPNKREAAEACNLEENSDGMVESAGGRLMSDLGLRSLLITRGSEGMSLFIRDEVPLNLPALARQVFDVTGAGDTVIATLAAGIAAGIPMPDAARIANIAAGLAVEQAGTTAIRLDYLSAHLNDIN